MEEIIKKIKTRRDKMEEIQTICYDDEAIIMADTKEDLQKTNSKTH